MPTGFQQASASTPHRPTSGAHLHKSYPAVKEAIAGVRHDVAAVASFLGANDEAIERIRLAVSEASTDIVQNVFEHSTGRIHVSLARIGDGELAVSVSGDGADKGSFEAGRGLSFIVMRECADALDVRQVASGVVEVEMRFSLRPAPARRSAQQARGSQRGDDGTGAPSRITFHASAD